MSQRNASKNGKRSRRTYPDELKHEAVQMYLDGQSAGKPGSINPRRKG